MPADSSVAINLSVNGASEASSALGSVSQGMAGIVQEHGRLAGAFSQRFQHIGLMLFVGEALRASGVGAETRMVISTLNLALTSMAGAFGASAGSIFLAVAALTAVGGVIAKVINHHKELSVALEKKIATDEKDIKSLNESIIEYEKLAHGIGNKLAPAYANVLEARKRLRDFMVNEEAKTNRENIKALEDNIERQRELIKLIDIQIAYQNNLNAVKIIATFVAQGLTAGTNALYLKFSDLNKKLQEAQGELLKYNTKLAEAKARQEALGNSAGETFDNIVKHANHAMEEMKKWIAEHKKAHDTMWQSIEKTAHSTFESIDKEQATAFAKMIVEGKSFSDLTAHLWSDMTEKIIADIESIIVKMALLYAFTGGSMDMGGFAGKMIFGGKFATGGSVIVDQPTMFMAGEAGAERATFTPLSGAGEGSPSSQSSSGVTINIGQVNTDIHGITDPDSIAAVVGRKIVESVRGLGQIPFTRLA